MTAKNRMGANKYMYAKKGKIGKCILISLLLCLHFNSLGNSIQDTTKRLMDKSEFLDIKSGTIKKLDMFYDMLEKNLDLRIMNQIKVDNIGSTSGSSGIREKLKDGSLLDNYFKIYSEKTTASEKMIFSTMTGSVERKLIASAADGGTISWDGNKFVIKDKSATKETIQIYYGNTPTGTDKFQYDIEIDGTKILYSLFNSIYPIGCVIISPTKPTIGTWDQVTTSKTGGATLWLGNNQAFGTVISQALPAPKFKVEKNGKHQHTYTSRINNDARFKWTGADSISWAINNSLKTSEQQDHDHTLTLLSGQVYSSSQTKVQPDAYNLILWKRTA